MEDKPGYGRLYAARCAARCRPPVNDYFKEQYKLGQMVCRPPADDKTPKNSKSIVQRQHEQYARTALASYMEDGFLLINTHARAQVGQAFMTHTTPRSTPTTTTTTTTDGQGSGSKATPSIAGSRATPSGSGSGAAPLTVDSRGSASASYLGSTARTHPPSKATTPSVGSEQGGWYLGSAAHSGSDGGASSSLTHTEGKGTIPAAGSERGSSYLSSATHSGSGGVGSGGNSSAGPRSSSGVGGSIRRGAVHSSSGGAGSYVSGGVESGSGRSGALQSNSSVSGSSGVGGNVGSGSIRSGSGVSSSRDGRSHGSGSLLDPLHSHLLYDTPPAAAPPPGSLEPYLPHQASLPPSATTAPPRAATQPAFALESYLSARQTPSEAAALPAALFLAPHVPGSDILSALTASSGVCVNHFCGYFILTATPCTNSTIPFAPMPQKCKRQGSACLFRFACLDPLAPSGAQMVSALDPLCA
eukprot:1152787-Pelagomonas_calceolata.AAC.4